MCVSVSHYLLSAWVIVTMSHTQQNQTNCNQSAQKVLTRLTFDPQGSNPVRVSITCTVSEIQQTKGTIKEQFSSRLWKRGHKNCYWLVSLKSLIAWFWSSAHGDVWTQWWGTTTGLLPHTDLSSLATGKQGQWVQSGLWTEQGPSDLREKEQTFFRLRIFWKRKTNT